MDFNLLLPLLERLGAGFVADLSRSELENRLRKGLPRAVKRLEKDGITPAALSGTDREKRILIRTCLYWVFKGLVRRGTPADLLRDAYDDPVVELVTPAVTAEMTTADLCERVMTAALDVMF